MSVIDPGFHQNSSLQFGVETAWGTAVAATKRLPFKSQGIDLEVGSAASENINASLGRKTILTPIGKRAAGPIVFELDYENHLPLFDGYYGRATGVSHGTAGTAPTGSGPYTYVFYEKPLLNSYTYQLGEGNIPAGKVRRTPGGKIVSLRLSGTAAPDASGIINIEARIVGTDKEPNVTPTGSLSAPTDYPVYFQELTFDDGSEDDVANEQVIRSFDLEMTSSVDENRRRFGSTSILEPVRSGFVSARLSFEREFNTESLLAKLRAGDTVTPVLTFDRTGDTDRQIKFELSGKVVRCTNRVEGQGIMSQQVEVEAFLTDTTNDYIVRSTIKNGKATVFA